MIAPARVNGYIRPRTRWRPGEAPGRCGREGREGSVVVPFDTDPDHAVLELGVEPHPDGAVPEVHFDLVSGRPLDLAGPSVGRIDGEHGERRAVGSDRDGFGAADGFGLDEGRRCDGDTRRRGVVGASSADPTRAYPRPATARNAATQPAMTVMRLIMVPSFRSRARCLGEVHGHLSGRSRSAQGPGPRSQGAGRLGRCQCYLLGRAGSSTGRAAGF